MAADLLLLCLSDTTRVFMNIIHVTALETTGHPLEVPWSTVHREAAKGDTTVHPPTPTDATVDIGAHADRLLVGEWTTVLGMTPTGPTVILLEYQEVGAMVQVKGVAIALFRLSSRGIEKPGLFTDTISQLVRVFSLVSVLKGFLS